MSDLIREKSYDFALRIVKLSEYLNNEKREYVLSKKVLDSGTNIGLLIEEGRQGENRADFIQKWSVANKEAFKTNFLLRLLRDSEFIKANHAESLLTDYEELQKLLITALKTAKRNA
jgi:four helix bundle protein